MLDISGFQVGTSDYLCDLLQLDALCCPCVDGYAVAYSFSFAHEWELSRHWIVCIVRCNGLNWCKSDRRGSPPYLLCHPNQPHQMQQKQSLPSRTKEMCLRLFLRSWHNLCCFLYLGFVFFRLRNRFHGLEVCLSWCWYSEYCLTPQIFEWVLQRMRHGALLTSVKATLGVLFLCSQQTLPWKPSHCKRSQKPMFSSKFVGQNRMALTSPDTDRESRRPILWHYHPYRIALENIEHCLIMIAEILHESYQYSWATIF